MDDIVPMRVLKSPRRFKSNSDGLVYVKSAFLFENLGQRLPFYIFHADIPETLILGNVMNVDNIGVSKPCYSLGFSLKSFDK